MARTKPHIARRWMIDHARREKVAFRILQSAMRDMALSIPTANLSQAMAPAAISANVTPEKLAPAIYQIWMLNSMEEAQVTIREVEDSWGEQKNLSIEELRGILSSQIRRMRRLDIAAMTLTFQNYLIAQINKLWDQSVDLNTVIIEWLTLLAATRFYAGGIARIARTETTASSNFGRQAASQTLGVLTKKTWLTMLDERVRADRYPRFNHRVLHGVTISASELFEQGGVSLRFPGDPMATPPARAAGMIINCRCMAVYTPDRDTRGRIQLRA